MVHEGSIKTKEADVEVAVGVTPMAVEVEAEEVVLTRMVGTSFMTSLETIIQGITIGEGAVGVVGRLTTTMVQLLKMVIPQLTLELLLNGTSSLDRILLTSFTCGW